MQTKRQCIMALVCTAVLILAGCRNNTATEETNNKSIDSEIVTDYANNETPENEDTEEETDDGGFAALMEDIANMPIGTAGSSLKAAGVAERVLSYAFVYGFPDLQSAQPVIQDAYDSLSNDDKAMFIENFPSVQSIIDSSFSGNEETQGTLEDAGVLESFQTLLNAPSMLQNWQTLKEAIASIQS